MLESRLPQVLVTSVSEISVPLRQLLLVLLRHAPAGRVLEVSRTCHGQLPLVLLCHAPRLLPRLAHRLRRGLLRLPRRRPLLANLEG